MSQAPASEISVIGGILAFPNEAEFSFRTLSPEMFTNAWLSKVFAVCAALKAEGIAPDITMVEDRIGVEHRKTLVHCVAYMPSLAGFEDYCAAVLEAWRRRVLCQKLQSLSMEAPSTRELITELDAALQEQRAIEQVLNDSTATNFKDSCTRYLDSIMRPNTAIRTGWADFDRRIGGLQREGFYIIFARSGKGKTDFALSMATNISCRQRVSYFSMEMSVEQLMERVTSRMAHVEGDRLRDRTVTPEDMKRVSNAIYRMKEGTNLIFDEKTRMSVLDLENKILLQRPDVAFIDHVGLMSHAPAKNVWEAVAATSQRLKELAKKHKLVLVGLVQENRTGDLKGSDNLNNDADGIFRISSEVAEEISGEGWIDAEVQATKNRHGGTGNFLYHWQPQYHDWRLVERRRE